MDWNVLAVGDVVAPAGLQFLQDHLKAVRKLHGVDFCVVNGENASMVGLTPEQAEAIFEAGADVVTLGNHTWNKRQIIPSLRDCPALLRPANYPRPQPGHGWCTLDTDFGAVTVIDLIGRCSMPFTPVDDPFAQVERILRQCESSLVLVDFHAEATSEKLAMGWMLDGRVSAVWGTHTHVPTADCQVLPKGTGYVTDLGMTGPAQSVLGVRPDQSVANFRGELTTRFEPAPGPCKLESVLFTIDLDTGLCLHAERIDIHD